MRWRLAGSGLLVMAACAGPGHEQTEDKIDYGRIAAVCGERFAHPSSGEREASSPVPSHDKGLKLAAIDTGGDEALFASPPYPSEAGRGERDFSELRELVLRLSQQDGDDGRRTCARVLREMARLCARDGADGPRAAARALRADADKIEDGGDAFAQADVIKHALLATLDGLKRAGRGDGAVKAWLQNAVKAVNAIRPKAPIDFQRPAIQDAIRAVADTMAVAGDQPPSSSLPR